MSRAARLCALIALAVMPRSSQAAPREAEEVHHLLEQWRVDAAAARVAELRKTHGELTEVLLADAHVRFQQGDYTAAIALFDRALPHLSAAAQASWRGLRDLVSATAQVTAAFQESRSPDGHFVIRHAARDRVLIPYALAALQSARREIAGRDFDAIASLGDPVRVEIYGEVADLAKVSTLTLSEIETSGTIALCKWNRLMIVSPRALLRGYPWLDTLAHEFTHFVISHATDNSVPIWLHEGLAKFEERRWRQAQGGALTSTMEHLLATGLARGHLIPFAAMHPSMAKLPSQADTALAFAEVHSAVEYLYERKGWAGVRQLLWAMKGGADSAQAISGMLGQSFDEFQRAWQSWLHGRKLRARPGLVPTALKFAARGRKADTKDDDTQEVTEERARRFTRLGGLLETRGRLGPAIAEYEKANAVLGVPHAVISGRLARSYLGLGQLDRAIAAATAALELYPDSAGLSVTLGQAWHKKGEPARAIVAFEAALRVNPFDPTPHCSLAQLYDESDKRRQTETNACGALRGPQGSTHDAPSP